MQEFIIFAERHWQLHLLLAVALVVLLVLELIKLKRQASQLNPSQLTEMINHKNAAVVDIRPSDTFKKGHIIDAISSPTQEGKLADNKLEKFKANPLVLVCDTGVNSQKFAALLKKAGYNVYSLKGGMRAWKEANMPVVK